MTPVLHPTNNISSLIKFLYFLRYHPLCAVKANIWQPQKFELAYRILDSSKKWKPNKCKLNPHLQLETEVHLVSALAASWWFVWATWTRCNLLKSHENHCGCPPPALAALCKWSRDRRDSHLRWKATDMVIMAGFAQKNMCWQKNRSDLVKMSMCCVKELRSETALDTSQCGWTSETCLPSLNKRALLLLCVHWMHLKVCVTVCVCLGAHAVVQLPTQFETVSARQLLHR